MPTLRFVQPVDTIKGSNIVLNTTSWQPFTVPASTAPPVNSCTKFLQRLREGLADTVTSRRESSSGYPWLNLDKSRTCRGHRRTFVRLVSSPVSPVWKSIPADPNHDGLVSVFRIINKAVHCFKFGDSVVCQFQNVLWVICLLEVNNVANKTGGMNKLGFSFIPFVDTVNKRAVNLYNNAKGSKPLVLYLVPTVDCSADKNKITHLESRFQDISGLMVRINTLSVPIAYFSSEIFLYFFPQRQ